MSNEVDNKKELQNSQDTIVDVETTLKNDHKPLKQLNTSKKSKKKLISAPPTPIDLLIEDNESTALYLSIFKTIQYVLLYFASSISLTLFIKHVVTYSETKYPLTNLSLQMFVNTLLSGFVSYFIIRNQLRTINADEPVTMKMVLKRLFNVAIFKKLVPFGCLTGIDYGLSNLSFSFISVTLYTMLKSSIPVFVLLVSFLARMERPTWSLNTSIILISVGISVAAGTSESFSLLGVTLVLIASLLGGFRLVYVQYILQPQQEEGYAPLETEDMEKSPPASPIPDESKLLDTPASIEVTPTAQLAEYITDNTAIRDHHQKRLEGKKLDNELSSVQMFFLTAPIIGAAVIPFAMILEGFRVYNKFNHISSLEEDPLLPAQNHQIFLMQLGFVFKIIMNVLIGAFFAFFLNVSEFLLIKETSGITFTVLGIIKELLLIASSMFVFQDKLTPINIIGYSISLVGIIMFKINRYYKMKQAIHETLVCQNTHEKMSQNK
jgi:solute carrier family 35 protein C2